MNDQPSNQQPTIARAMVQDAVRALGLDPTTVSAVTLEPHAVTVTRCIPVVADVYEIEDPDHD